jgi:glycosyltransferase involved in cell wall biosynthesis
MYAGVKRPDILHIHAIGPAVVTPLARVLGLKVVVTHHGPDYDRDKWGSFARSVLRVGESVGMQFADARIAISKGIFDLVRSKYGLDCDIVPNGVVSPELCSGTEHLAKFGLVPGRYFLQVGRMVPEKRQLDLIEAFRAARASNWKLVLVGGLASDAYCEKLRAAAAAHGVVLTDYLTGQALHQLYTHAGAFVLPSSHEGLPIALLEALSYGLPVLASDIAANLEVGLESSSYFPLGNIDALAARLRRIVELPQETAVRQGRQRWVAQKYNWDDIAVRTLTVYRRIASQRFSKRSSIIP